MSPSIDEPRLSREIEELAGFSDTPYPSVTRVLFTETDMRARAWLIDRMAAAGLAVRVDAVGNTFARWEGEDPELPAVATGSHIDAIPDAGRFDGVVGVLGGLEAIRPLRAAGVRPRRSIELIMFTAEEPTRFAYRLPGQPRPGRGRRRRAARAPARRRGDVARRGPRGGGHLGLRGRGPPGAGRTTPPSSSCTSSRAPSWSARACRSGW